MESKNQKLKSYKLIKEYPGSPRNHSIVKEDDSILSNLIIKEWEDYWQEVVEKDYEILSFRSTRRNTYYFGKICTDCQKGESFLNQYLANNKTGLNEIYSIKRISDGEVFTVGDNTTLGTLSKIEIVGIEKAKSSGCAVYFGAFTLKDTIWDTKEMQWDNTADLCFRKFNKNSEDFLVKKLSKPLFTTEDGVDIFEGDRYYWIIKDLRDSNVCSTKATKSSPNGYNLLYFSTKEKAEEYILMNKPILSVNDILSVDYQDGKYNNIIIEKEQLLKLAKKKLS